MRTSVNNVMFKLNCQSSNYRMNGALCIILKHQSASKYNSCTFNAVLFCNQGIIILVCMWNFGSVV